MGALPPNSRNGAFIHDPNMTGEKEVVAEVKLAFINLSGQSMVATRSAKVTNTGKKANYTFKTLENQLLMMNRGERSTISSKCAELDEQIPRYLGVPPAILDYVVFCHQEEGLWPLQEPLTLKKKFDEIFQALKFTKAVENLKSIRKDLEVEVKLLEQSASHLKQDKERSDRTKERLQSTLELKDEYIKEAEILQEELKHSKDSNEALFKSNQDFQAVLSRLESLIHTQRSLNQQMTRLQDSTKLLPFSDEDLAYKSSNFETIMNETTLKVQELKKSLIDGQNSLKGLRNQQSNLIGQEGQLKAKKNEYETNVLDRDDSRIVIENQYDLVMNDNDYAGLEYQLKTFYNKQNKEFENLQKDIEENEANMQSEIRIVSESKVKEIQHRDYIAADISNIQKDINDVTNKINNLKVNEGNIEYERSSLEDMEQKLSSFKQNNYLETINKDIKNKNNEISTIENEIEDISKEISQIHKQSDAHSRISLLKDELKFKEKALMKLRESNKGLLVEHGLEFESASESLSKLIQRAEAELKETQIKYNNHRSQIAGIESNIEHLEASSKQYTEDICVSKKKVDDILEGEPVEEYDDIVSSADDDYKLTLENLKMFTTTFAFNKKALEHLQSHHACYLCHTKFEEGPVLKNLSVALEKQINGSQEAEFRDQLKQAEEYQQNVRSIANDVSKLLSIKPKLDKCIHDLGLKRSELESSKTILSSIEDELSKLERKISSLSSLRNPVNELERLSNESKSLKNQVEEKSKELSDFGYSSKSLEELQESLEKKNTLLKSVRKSVSTLFEEKDSKQRELTLLEGNTKDKRLRISTMERSLVEKENMIKLIEGYKLKITDLEKSSEKSIDIIKGFEEQLSLLKESFVTIHEENQLKYNESKAKVSKLLQTYEEFSQLNEKIQDYETNFSTDLEKCERSLNEIGENIVSSEKKLEEYQNTINEEELKLVNSNNEHINLKNNIELRHLQIEISETEQEISNINVAEAEAARDEYQERSRKLQDEFSKLNAAYGGKMGEIKQLEDQYKQIKRELNTEFKNVDEKYRQELAKFRFKSVALTDAATYTKAIDSAIMNFHSLKMKETNKIIDDLWKGTYSGTDVDTIQIRSDPVTTAAKNRSYNYRVVMVKNQVELDMRGRCSAGQKVLVSIIIRLALAECFGTNCGVIALDEPTTNLDADNIESLARSLANIIELRKSQKNFQLIVITHDEKFLNAMNASKYTDHFFRVKRNQAQKSEIEKVMISRITE